MIIDRGTSIKCPQYTKDIIETIGCKRRSKSKGISVDKKQLTQLETLLLICYLIAKDNEVYEKLIKIEFPRELINKLLRLEDIKNV